MKQHDEQEHSNKPVPIKKVSWHNSFSDIVSSTGMLEKPKVVEDFDNLTTPERIVEALRYNVHSFEYAISPKGEIRRWLKFNLRLFIIIGIPLLLIIPLVMLLIGIGEDIDTFTKIIGEVIRRFPDILKNVLRSLLLLLIVFSVIYCLYGLVKFHRHMFVQIFMIIIGTITILILLYRWFLYDIVRAYF